MSIKTWKPNPLSNAIMEILEKKHSLTDVNIYNSLKDDYKGVGFSLFNETLMKMEIEGKIHVSTFRKGKRIIQLIKS